MPSSPSTPTSSTVNQSNLPEYARPYFERMMSRTETESNQPYVPYQGARVASFSPSQTDSMNMVKGIANGPNEGETPAWDAAGQAGDAAKRAENYNSKDINVGMFDKAAADKYMSPYMDDVVQRQKDAAQRDYLEGRAGRESNAQASGAFGGYRDSIQRGVAERGLNNQMGDIQAKGLQDAYTNAQGQFERDRSAGFTADATNESNRRAAAGVQLQGGQLGLQTSGQMAALGKQYQDMNLQKAGALGEVGDKEYAQQQKYLDTDYNDFVNQRDYEKNRLGFESGILRGVPVQANTDSSTYSNPNPLSSALGLGIAGIGAYNAYKK